MFQGVAVDGSTSYVPRQSNQGEYFSTDEDLDEDEGNHLTPLSIGSKRSSSSRNTRSTSASLSKKSRSPSVRSMDNNMRNLNVILENKTAVIQNIWAER
jgi:hypothetical protein